jgi:hypothetical protein
MKPRSRFQDEAGAAPIIYRHVPARRDVSSTEEQVLIPALQAVLLAGSWALLGAVVAIFVAIRAHIGLLTALAASGGLFLALFALLVTNFISERRRLLWGLERLTRVDLDQDGTIGPPDKQSVTVELVDRARKSIRYVDLPLNDDELAVIARAVLAEGVEWSRRSLEAAGFRGDYSAILDPLLEAGLLAHRGRGKTAGVELTGSGRAFLRQYL